MKLRPEELTFVSVRAPSGAERTLIEVAPSWSPVRPRPGDRIGQYEVIEELGAGGMATVYLSRDLQLGRRVALKIAQSNNPEVVQRLLTEARFTACCRHVNIVVLYEIGEHEGSPFIALEYLRGEPLAKLVENHGRLPYARAVEIAVPLLRALAHIHDLGIVHRDLKPENVFMSEQGMPKLLDFGIAKYVPTADASGAVRSEQAAMANARMTRAGGFVGTPEYSAPEQWHGAGVDRRTDIWSLGVLLHRLICGRHPLYTLAGNELFVTGVLEIPMPSMRESAPIEVPHALIDVVDRCLLKLKDQRWQSADELLEALLPFLAGHLADISTALPDARPPDVSPEVSSPGTPSPEVLPEVSSPDAPSIDTAPVGTPPGASCVEDVAPQGAPCEAVPSISGGAVRVNEAPVHGPDAHHARPSSANERPGGSPSERRKHVILCVASDASETDGSERLGRQTHAIRAELERAGSRDRFDLVTQFVSDPLDLLHLLRRYRPTVMYFVGAGREITSGRHGQRLVGDRFGGLFFRDRNGAPLFLTAGAVEQTFGAAGRSVRLVVLNGCYAEIQARALLAHVDCVAGTHGTDDPDAAIALAYGRGLLGGIGYHESIATAHRQGCAAIGLMGLSGGAEPQLDVRLGVDAESLVLADLW